MTRDFAANLAEVFLAHDMGFMYRFCCGFFTHDMGVMRRPNGQVFFPFY